MTRRQLMATAVALVASSRYAAATPQNEKEPKLETVTLTVSGMT